VGLLLWLALLVLVVSVTAGAAFVVFRALALWRSVKSFAAALENAVTAVVATAARLTAEAEALGTTLPRVEQRVSQLQVSLARLAVLRAAVQDVRDAIAGVTAVYPSK
jgi:hypothetical protein